MAKGCGFLSQGKLVPQKSNLASLRPIIGSDGLLTVGGRLPNAVLTTIEGIQYFYQRIIQSPRHSLFIIRKIDM